MMQVPVDGEVKAAFIVPKTPGMRDNGLVLVEMSDQWVTWYTYWTGDTTGDNEGFTHELWQLESGNYFRKGDDPDLARQQAEYDFGLRLGRFFTDSMYRGIN